MFNGGLKNNPSYILHETEDGLINSLLIILSNCIDDNNTWFGRGIALVVITSSCLEGAL